MKSLNLTNPGVEDLLSGERRDLERRSADCLRRVGIGLVDNVLRPLLVGKDTKLPDYIVLISTLSGIAIFGLNGFVIGPVIAAMFMAVWDIVASSRGEVHTQEKNNA